MDTEKTTENRTEEKVPRLKTRPDRFPLLKTKPDTPKEPDADPERTERSESKTKRRTLLKTKPDRKKLQKGSSENTITEAEEWRRERARQARDRKDTQKKRARKKKLIRMAVYILIAVLAVLLIFAVVAIVRRAKTSHEERIAEEAYQAEISNSDFFAPADVLHLSFPVLSLDEAGSGLSVSEFRLILDDLYKKGYVLVDPYSLVERSGGGFAPAQIMVPTGKKPMILSQYDVSYKEGDTDHAYNLQIDSSGKISAGYINESGFEVSGDVDVVPILEDFLKEHPDFSVNNARGILGVTGYNGVLGYKIEKDTTVKTTIPIEETEQQKREREAAELAQQQLEEYGYLYGYDYGYTDYGYTTGDAGDGSTGHVPGVLTGGAGLLMNKDNTAFLRNLANTVDSMRTVYVEDSGTPGVVDLINTDTDTAGTETDTSGTDGTETDAADTGSSGTNGDSSEDPEGQKEERSEEDLWISRNTRTLGSLLSALRGEGWRIASGSYGMVSYGSSNEIVAADAEQWQTIVAPLVGQTDMILIPGGGDIGPWSGYAENNAKYMLLKDQGFKYFFMNDSESLTWAQIRPGYVRQGMHMIPDYASYLALMNGSEGSAVLVREAASETPETEEGTGEVSEDDAWSAEDTAEDGTQDTEEVPGDTVLEGTEGQ